MTLCPLCRSAAVATPTWSFSDTSVQVETCADCRSTSGVVSVTMKVSALADLYVSEGALRHREGLVTFS